MKKLLVLMLVLGMASLASATILTDIELVLDGGVITIVGVATTEIVNSDGWGLYAITLETTSATRSIVEVGGTGLEFQQAGNLAGFGYVYVASSYEGYAITVFNSTLSPGAIVLGDWFTFEYSGEVGDKFSVYDVGNGSSYSGDITVTPEPMTLALLGLGGLFLRRKK